MTPRSSRTCIIALLAPVMLAVPAHASPASPRAVAMSKLSYMRGVWIGLATGVDPTGKAYKVTQTERMGPMLGGDVIVIEGRGYNEDGSTGFNAFGVVSWSARTERYEIRSYAQGEAGTFELTLTKDGYTWEIPAGSNAKIHFTAAVRDGRWHEVGEYVSASKPPVKTFEMTLKRTGDTDWPLGAPVSPALGK